MSSPIDSIRKCGECNWYSSGICLLLTYWSSQYHEELILIPADADPTALPSLNDNLAVVKCGLFNYDMGSENPLIREFLEKNNLLDGRVWDEMPEVKQ